MANHADIRLLAGLDLQSSEQEILKAIQILQKNLQANQQAKIKLDVQIDQAKLQQIVSTLQQLSKRSDLRTSTQQSIANITKEATQLTAVAKATEQVIKEKKELATVNDKVAKSAKDAETTMSKQISGMNMGASGASVQNMVMNLHTMNNTAKHSHSIFGNLKNAISNTFSSGKLAMTSYLAVLRSIDTAARDAKEAIIELNQAETDLMIATNMSRESVKGLIKDYNIYGKLLASTTTEITDAANDYLRAGKDLKESQALIKDSIMLSKLGQIDSDEATEDLLATMNGYNMAVEQVDSALDAMVAIDMKAATSAGDLATGLKYSASSANAAGLEFNKLVAMLAVTQDRTQQTAQVIGTFANTILSRYRDITIGKYLSDDGEDISNYESVLKSVGIELRDNAGEFRAFETVLEEMAGKWDSLTSVQQNALIKVTSGTRQQNRFIALMENYNKVLELTEVAANSAGTAVEKFNSSYLTSLEAKQNTLQASFESMIYNVNLDEVYGDILDATTAIVEFINKANLLKGVMTGLTVGAGVKGFLTLKTGIHQAYISLNQFQQALNLIKQTNISNKDFKTLLLLTNGLSDSQTKLILSSKNLTLKQKEQILVAQGLSSTEAKLKLQTLGVTSAQTGLTASTISLKGALQGLWTTLMASPILLIIAGVTTAVSAFTSYQNKMKEVRQATVDAATDYQESTKSINDYISRYQDLQKALQDAKGDEEATATVKQQLLELQNELNDTYGAEYGKLNLVTDAYKDQTEAIKELSKAEANRYLNENREGIATATKKMSKKKDYILTSGTVTSYSSRGKALQEVADSYADQGLTVEKNSVTSAMELKITADAQTAYDVINDFESDLRAKAIELGNEHLFDDVLKVSSKALNKAKEVVDEYGDIYNQALMAQLVTNEPMSAVYYEALKAVETYNKALVTGENVTEAKKNLDDVKAKIEGNSDTWGKYASITEDIFAQAGADISNYADTVTDTMGKVEEKTKSTKSQMIDTINSMADGFDVLDDIYADVLDGGTFDFTKLDTSKFSEAFKEITPEYEKFIETVSASPTDIDACQGAFNDLVSAFIDSKGILDNLTEENKDLTISMLQNMGVANAEDIVLAHLNGTVEELAIYKQFTAEKGYELANATYAEVAEFLNEAEASAVAKQELAQLALEKINVNENQISTASDIDNIITLVEAARAGTAELAQLAKAKSILSAVESAGTRERAGISEKAYQDALKTVEQINNGTFDYNYQKIDRSQFSVADYDMKPKYTGADQTASALEKSVKEAANSAKDSYSDWYDFMERRTEVLNDSFELLEKGTENVVGAFAKNQLVDTQLRAIDEEITNYTDALPMYKAQANNVLSEIDNPELREKIVNGAVELTDIQGENEEQVKAALDAYKNWSGKIQETTQRLEELRTQIRQLELQKFENIIEDYTNQFDLYGDSIDLIKGQIELLEEAGELVGKNYFTAQITQSEKQLMTLEKQKADMLKQMTDAIDYGRIQRGTDEWLRMQRSLTEVESEIIDVKTNIEELKNDLQELNWSIFERVHTEFRNLNSELENLAGLFDDFNDIKVSDGKGTWTDEAISTLGLYMQQMELARHQANSYSEAIDKLNEDFQNGDYSAVEYMDKLSELKENMWQSVNSAESLEDAIVFLNETRINKEIETIEDEIDAYEELIDSKLKALNAEKELHDYRLSIEEKNKAITDIEKQLTAMANDDSLFARAKKAQLQEQLAEARKDLEETEYDHSIESQKSALEEQLQEYTDARNTEIETLRLSLENRELLISQSFETVKANASTVGEQIALIAQQHGVTVSDAIITSWIQGENAIASYGETLSAQSSAFIGNIMGVESEVYNLQMQADNSSIALANMFATRADNLVGQLQSSWYAEDNLNYATNVLQNSLVNTLERGYNISGISSALNGISSGLSSVANQANRTAQAIREALGAQEEAKTYYHMGVSTGAGKSKYYVSDLYGNDTEWYNSYEEASKALDKLKTQNYNYKAYAKGSKFIPKEQLGWTQDKGSEMIIRPSDGAILTPLKRGDAVANAALTENLFKWGEISPESFMPDFGKSDGYKINVPVKPVERDITINYHNTFNGDFNNTEQLMDKMKSVAKSTTTGILKDINRDFRIHGR